MPLSLPRADFGLLPSSPLELVVCQVRHDDRLVDANVAIAIQEALGGATGFFPRVESVEMHVTTMAVGPGIASPGPTQTSRGWHLKSADGTWTAAVLPGHFSLETTRYTRWQEFHKRFVELALAVSTHAAPVIEQRLGLRYTDRLTALGVRETAEWSSWIEPSILGPALHPVIGPAVSATRQQIDIDLGDGDVCVLRHGTIRDLDAPPDAEQAYLLDFDVYRSQSRRFDPESIALTTSSFHEKADALFGQVITDDLLRHLESEHNA